MLACCFTAIFPHDTIAHEEKINLPSDHLKKRKASGEGMGGKGEKALQWPFCIAVRRNLFFGANCFSELIMPDIGMVVINDF